MTDDLPIAYGTATPIGWVKTELGEIGSWGSGGTPKATNDKYYNGSIPWAKIGDLNDGLVVKTEDYITEEGLINSSAKIVEEGTLLVAMYGSIGKLGIAGVKLSTNQAIAFCKVNEKLVAKEFVFYYLRSRREHLLSMGQGGTQQNISQTILKAYPILLPPLNEQRRIVEKLDRIIDRLRRARHELSHIKKLIDRYRQAVLTAAFHGNLTADWREKLGWKRTQWQNLLLDELISEYQNGVSKRSGDGKQEVIVLRLADIKDFKICLSNPRKIKLSLKEIDKYKLKSGDILIIRVNGSKDIVGRLVLITQNLNVAYCDHFIRLRLTSKCNSYWLSYYGNTNEFRKYINENMVSSAGQNTVSQGTLKDHWLEIPPLEEQKEIVRRIEERFAKIDKLEQEYQKAVKLCDRLEQATLAKAFRGELVPQDPNDEPASILLERIRAEQQSKTKAKTAKSKKRSGKK